MGQEERVGVVVRVGPYIGFVVASLYSPQKVVAEVEVAGAGAEAAVLTLSFRHARRDVERAMMGPRPGWETW